jgi:hypothetical protein
MPPVKGKLKMGDDEKGTKPTLRFQVSEKYKSEYGESGA